MRVVGGTDYISIAEQQKYFQWFSTDCSETCAELLQISWATFNFIEKKRRALGFGSILQIFLD